MNKTTIASTLAAAVAAGGVAYNSMTSVPDCTPPKSWCSTAVVEYRGYKDEQCKPVTLSRPCTTPEEMRR